ncbi:MAG TPA: hypothetical protein VJM34_09995 [Novosphingobium sp.]|nr:hypothetical protein [Novosphingobium sp.]
MPAAHILAIAGATAVFLTVLAWIGDARRMRRADLDRVGVMPWTALFFLSLLVACVLLGLAARAEFAG